MNLLKAVLGYVVARLTEASTQAAVVAAASSLGGGILGALSWREAIIGAIAVLLPALVPDGWGPFVARVIAALLKGAKKTAPVLIVLVGAGWLVVACSADQTAKVDAAIAKAEASAPEIFKQGCAAVSIADGSFKAVAPALVASGKLQAADLDREAAIFASVQVTCANPPADVAAVAPQLLGQASAIYLLIAAK